MAMFAVFALVWCYAPRSRGCNTRRTREAEDIVHGLNGGAMLNAMREAEVVNQGMIS